MITKYETGGYYGNGVLIKPVEIERESDKSVWLKDGSRRDKVASYHIYHDSWQGARDHLMKVAEQKVISARLALERANSHLGNIKGLKP